MGNTTFNHQAFRAGREVQGGAALLVVVVLLLLTGLLTLLALNVGVFEQRSTANDVRARTVREVAEAGLSQAAEYLLRQHPDLMEAASWEPCASGDESFPCGAVEQFEPDGATARRATMYRWIGTGATVSTFASELTQYMLPLSGTISQVGGFNVNYGVAPLLCYVAPRSEVATDPIRCTTKDAASKQRLVTFASVGSMQDESARTTLVQTVGRYNLFDGAPGLPPVIASGSVDVVGTLQIVTNPNAAGTGVPVSVWTRKDVVKHGTANTCYADEFFRPKKGKPTAPTFYQGMAVCDDCSCPDGDNSLSFGNSGGAQEEGIDILDVEGNSQTLRDGQDGVNYNVRSDALSWPTCEFPPDLFAHLFKVAAWEDADHDCVGEVKIMTSYKNPNTGNDVTMGADEAYLFANANLVVNPTGETNGANLLRADQRYTGAFPAAGLSGLIWCQSNCDIGSNTELGSPSNPVVLVIDGAATIHGKVYGIVFLRTKLSDRTLTPTAAGGNKMTIAQIATGGSADLRMNAQSVVYGSVIIQGQANKLNGGASIIYSGMIMDNIAGAANDRFSTLPGAWTDKWSY